MRLESPHDHRGNQLLWPGQDGSGAEEYSRIIKLQARRSPPQLWRIVDGDAILGKRRIAAGIAWLAGIDRHLKERAASAAQRFQRDRQGRTADVLQIGQQLFRNRGAHRFHPLSFVREI